MSLDALRFFMSPITTWLYLLHFCSIIHIGLKFFRHFNLFIKNVFVYFNLSITYIQYSSPIKFGEILTNLHICVTITVKIKRFCYLKSTFCIEYSPQTLRETAGTWDSLLWSLHMDRGLLNRYERNNKGLKIIAYI